MPRERDENKVQEILQASLKIAISTGFSGLKMADVAQQAGMATGTLYIYFKNKEELINAAYLSTKKEIAALLNDVRHQGTTYYDTFKNTWYAYIYFCQQFPEKMLFVEQFIYSGFILEENKQLAEKQFSPFNAFIEELQAQRFILQTDIELVKAQLMGPIHEIVKVQLSRKTPLSQAQLDQCFQMAWNSVRL